MSETSTAQTTPLSSALLPKVYQTPTNSQTIVSAQRNQKIQNLQETENWDQGGSPSPKKPTKARKKRRRKRPSSLHEAILNPPKSTKKRIIFSLDYTNCDFNTSDFKTHRYATKKIKLMEVESVLNELLEKRWFLDLGRLKQKTVLIFLLSAVLCTLTSFLILYHILHQPLIAIFVTIAMPFLWLVSLAFLSFKHGRTKKKRRTEKLKAFLEEINQRLGKNSHYFYKAGYYGGWLEIRLKNEFFDFEAESVSSRWSCSIYGSRDSGSNAQRSTGLSGSQILGRGGSGPLEAMQVIDEESDDLESQSEGDGYRAATDEELNGGPGGWNSTATTRGSSITVVGYSAGGRGQRQQEAQ